VPFRELTKRFFLGKSRDPLDPHVFHQLSLAAFLAWVGLEADGLSSSCYGPEEAVQRRLQFEGLQTVILPIQVNV
jgi:hypothetical protein